MRKWILLVMAFATLQALACTDEIQSMETSDDQVGTLTFSLESLSAAADTSDIRSFRLRIYPKAPATADEATLFDSNSLGCIQAGGTDVTVKDLKAGEDRFVFFEGFSDTQCSDRIALGLRGGISVVTKSLLEKKAENTACTGDDVCIESIHPDARCDCEKETDAEGKTLSYCVSGSSGICSVRAPIYIPLYATGSFQDLPSPSDSLRSVATQTSCDTDDECHSVHPAAVCDVSLGYCAVEGLFPLGPARPRAFHEAVNLPDGRLLFVGGFNRFRTGAKFLAASPYAETFNPTTGLFEHPMGEDFDGVHTGFVAASVLQSGIPVVAGGARQAEIRYEYGEESIELAITFPFEGELDCGSDGCDNFPATLYALDLVNGVSTESPLPWGAVGHTVEVVNRPTEAAVSPSILVSGGLAFSSTDQSLDVTGTFTQCSVTDILAGNASVCTADNNDLVSPRSTQGDVCIDRTAAFQPCNDYLMVGGVTGEDPVAEMFTTDEDYSASLTLGSTGSLQDAFFPRLVLVDASNSDNPPLYSFGGTTSVTKVMEGDSATLLIGPPDVSPAQLEVDLEAGRLNTTGIDTTAMDEPEATHRIFHTATALSDGRIAVIGGLGPDSLPTNQVLFFEDKNSGTLEYVGSATLKHARFGHTATRIDSGLLKGAILVVGGLSVDSTTAAVTFVNEAEIFIP